jgi:PAS domain S-box-containing protein
VRQLRGAMLDITQRKRAEEQIRLQAQLVDQVQAAVIANDLSGIVLHWNQHAETLYGWTREEMLGRDLLALEIAPADAAMQAAIFERLHAGEAWEGDMAARRKDGTTVPVYVRLSALNDAQGRLVGTVGVSVDITARRQAEDRLAAQHAVARILSESAGILEAAPEILAALCETLKWEYGGLWGVDRDAQLLHCVQTWSAPGSDVGAFEEVSRHTTMARGVGLPGRVWGSRQPAWIPDVQQDDDFPRAPAAVRVGLRAGVCFPVRRGHDILGVLEFLSHEIREPDRELLAMMNAIGQQVGQFFERRRAEEDLARRAVELAAVNAELEAFSYSVSHDLRAPLRSIDGFSQALLEDYADRLDDEGKTMLRRVRAGSQRMAELIDALLGLSRVTRSELRRTRVDLSAAARAIAGALAAAEPERGVEFVIADGIVVEGDARLLRVVLQNLLENAWKFTRGRAQARIEFGVTAEDGRPVYFVRDDGAGFDMAYAGKLFAPFQRMHAARDFSGTGIGLATVERIVRRHGGRAWAEGAVDRGATFYFTLEQGGR